MPWFGGPPRQILARLLRIGTAVWICHQVGCWARRLGRLGALVLRLARRGRPARRLPDYGHLLLDALYPGRPPSPKAWERARELADLSRERKAKDAEGALQLLGEAVLLCPPNASLHLARAQAHIERGQHVEALDDAELCVSLDPLCAAGWLAKGQAEQALGRTADATLSYQVGLRLEPLHAELASRLVAVRADPPPNVLMQLRDLVVAARLGLENLFRTVEDPAKTTDAFIEQNRALLDAQIGLLQQTLHVNTAVLLDSRMHCEAYEQIVHACAQLVAGAPAAFSHRLANAGAVLEGLSLALRVGWHVHDSTPKLAANALVVLGSCPEAEDGLRRQAVRHLLAGMLRWLLDARPEPDREGEEVCGCSCSAPWKAAACFLERLLEPGRPQPWVREECERWSDAAQLCQWLALSVRDYHATPLGLVGLLQMPGVAAAVMKSEAVVDFFIPTLLPEDEFEGSEVDAEAARGGGVGSSIAASAGLAGGGGGGSSTSTGGGAVAASSPPAASAAASTAASVASSASSAAVARGDGAGASTDFGGGDAAEAEAEDELGLPPTQRLGEWLMASIGYLLLFVEDDVLFTVAACRALKVMATVEPEGRGIRRLLEGMWLGVPLLNKLSLFACSHAAALDLLQCLFSGPNRGVRVAARSLACALAQAPASPPEAMATLADATDQRRGHDSDEGGGFEAAEGGQGGGGGAPTASSGANGNAPAIGGGVQASNGGGDETDGAATSGNPAAAAAAGAAPRAAEEVQILRLDAQLVDETVPSWAEFYHELLNELACAPNARSDFAAPELVTLLNFEEKAPLLAEQISIKTVAWASASVDASDGGSVDDAAAAAPSDDDAGGGHDASAEARPRKPPWPPQQVSLEVAAVPAAWNRLAAACVSSSSTSAGSTASTSAFATATPVAAVDATAVPSTMPSAVPSAGDADGDASAGDSVGVSAGGGVLVGEARGAAGEPPRLALYCPSQSAEGSEEFEVGSEAYISDEAMYGKVVLMSRRSIRQSSRVQNWAQAVSAAERAGAAAVIVYNNLDALDPFRMGLFGEPTPSIPAFMVDSASGAALRAAAEAGCDVVLERRPLRAAVGGASSGASEEDEAPPPPPWPLSGGRLPADVAQAWSLLEAMSAEEPGVQAELAALLARMGAPEKRVWLTRRLLRHHRSRQAPEGDVAEPPLAFVEGDRSLSPTEQLAALRRQLCEETGLGAEDLCGEFEVRFKDEQGVGSALLREWIDLTARQALLHPRNRLLRSYDQRRTFWPDPVAPFVNPQWQMDYEALGRLLGLALWHSCTLDLPLHPHVCALLMGIPREAVNTTLADVDPELDRHKVQWLLANPVHDLGFPLPFTDSLAADDTEAAAEKAMESTGEEGADGDESSKTPTDAAYPGAAPGADEEPAAAEQEPLPSLVWPEDSLPGTHRSWPGLPMRRVGLAEVALDSGLEGSQRLYEVVTDENKERFVNALAAWRLHDSVMPQIIAAARGLQMVLPPPVLEELRQLISPEEMAGLLSGLGEIDVVDWEQHTAYAQGLPIDAPVVAWFWRTVRYWASSPKDSVFLPRLLQFVTGSARVPVGGFSELVGFNGAKHPFTLSHGGHLTPQSLPMAHACICTLDLPPYTDEETCRAKLTQMLLLGRSYFDEAAGRAMRGEEVEA